MTELGCQILDKIGLLGLNLFLQLTVVFAVLLGAMRLFRRHPAVKHFIGCCALGYAAACPLLLLLAPVAMTPWLAIPVFSVAHDEALPVARPAPPTRPDAAPAAIPVDEELFQPVATDRSSQDTPFPAGLDPAAVAQPQAPSLDPPVVHGPTNDEVACEACRVARIRNLGADVYLGAGTMLGFTSWSYVHHIRPNAELIYIDPKRQVPLHENAAERQPDI